MYREYRDLTVAGAVTQCCKLGEGGRDREKEGRREGGRMLCKADREKGGRSVLFQWLSLVPRP